MKTLTIDHNNGHKSTYQLIEDGSNLPIAYHAETNSKVIEALEFARKTRTRIKVYLGDTATGRDWNEENDTFGYVGLSKGREARYPILVCKKSSYGGGSLLDHCIVKIRESKGSKVIYKAANYIAPIMHIEKSAEPGYNYALYVNGKLYSNHETEAQAQRLKTKLS